MQDVKIIDIDNEQWNMKDQEARNKIAVLEEKTVIKEEMLWSNEKEYIKIVTINDKRFLAFNFIGLTEASNIVQTQMVIGTKLNPSSTIYVMGNGDFKDGSGRVPVIFAFGSDGIFFTVIVTPTQSTGNYKTIRLYAHGFVNMD